MKQTLIVLLFSMHIFSSEFVSVDGTQFQLNNKTYTFMGTNFWYGLNLGSKGVGGDRERLKRELDKLSSLGIKNLRVMAATEGPNNQPYRMVPAMQIAPGKYDMQVVDGLDFLLSEMKKREMKAVMVLNNFWNWSGGMSQYLVWSGDNKDIPHPPPHPNGSWQKYQTSTAKFYASSSAQKMYQNHIKFIVTRLNPYTKILYKNDPTIMSWELANEPRGDKRTKEFNQWIHNTAKFIKELDPNHLVTTGSEGDTPFPSAGVETIQNHMSQYIDYATMHIWVQNWQIYNPEDPSTLKQATDFAINYIDQHEKKAQIINKPIILEEFGISRDKNDHSPSASTQIRDQFYKSIFKRVHNSTQSKTKAIRGVNFWAWAGEGRPNNINGLWRAGDDFIGDPAHEFQGWYSVYNKDLSTNKLIKFFAQKIN